MTYDKALAAVNASKDLYAYALDYTGWYLYILDKHDDEFPTPVAYDLMLIEYRDAYNIPDRAKAQLGWWTSTTHPDTAITRWCAVGPVDIACMLREWQPDPIISEQYIMEQKGLL